MSETGCIRCPPMALLLDLEEARQRLIMALQLVRQDRFLLGGLRDGRLKVIVDSNAPSPLPSRRAMDLSPLARRSLYERSTLAISSVIEDDALSGLDDWEMDWPSLIYAPVGLPQARPVGLLIVGSRKRHWYDQEDVSYITSLAVTMTACVSAITGPLGRLRPRERQVAQLLGEGLSATEIAEGLKIDPKQAELAIASVLRKLSLRSRKEIGQFLPDRPVSVGGFLI
jgi:DNA-binding CsgD family transcriptional regulator